MNIKDPLVRGLLALNTVLMTVLGVFLLATYNDFREQVRILNDTVNKVQLHEYRLQVMERTTAAAP